MDWSKEWKKLAGLGGIFALCFFLPLEWERFGNGLREGLELVRWYAREHVILCLIPAFYLAGAIATFVRQDAVLRHLGPGAPKPAAYAVASVSGTILAVCSCTVLPLFAGIWRMGAGLGPAVAFLYSGPAISVLAVILTARVLGLELGVARALGAVAFAALIGLLMALAFRKEEAAKAAAAAHQPDPGPPPRPLWQTVVWIGLMVAVLVFANWSGGGESVGVVALIGSQKWLLTSGAAVGLGLAMGVWFGVPWWKVAVAAAVTALAALAAPGEVLVPFAAGAIAVGWIAATTTGEMQSWFEACWDFTKLIAPLLLLGVFASGLLLGRPGHEGLIPPGWVAAAVGGNSLLAVLAGSVLGAFLYFATLTEIPILQGLLGSGMGAGPALALLLAGPAISLPSLLALGRIMGWKKTLLYALLVMLMAALCGWVYGRWRMEGF